MSCHILCAHSDPSVIERLEKVLRELARDRLCIGRYGDAPSLLAAALEIQDSDEGEVAMVFSDLAIAGTESGDLFQSIRNEPSLRSVRKILLDSVKDSAAVDALLQQGLMRARLDPEFDREKLEQLLKLQLTDFAVSSAPYLIDELLPLLDLQSMAGALSSARKNFELLSQRMSEVQRSVVGETQVPDAKVEDAMINEFDRVLDSPERRRYLPGEDLVCEGDQAGRIWIILFGRVKLIRTIEGEEVIYHSESAGRIVGLMSLSLQNPVFFTCRAITEVKAIVLTREQVRDAIQQSATLPHHFITVMMRTMSRRNARSAELLTEVRTLNSQLARQRDELGQALETLRSTQNQLIDAAKMATLGNLAAGMAHELNNPAGAMIRSAEHLGTDLDDLLRLAPELRAVAGLIPRTRGSPPLSTREERRLRRQLATDLKLEPPDVASLVDAGIRTKDQFEAFAREHQELHRDQGDRNAWSDEMLRKITLASRIGISLRTLTNCSKRISDLVRSLRIYVRDEKERSPGVNLNQTLDDALLILANQVKPIDLRKDYGEIPLIEANASQLQQVWTNLISNAAQALEGKGRISLRSSTPLPGWIRVEIEDNGPGISAEAREKLWDTRFTTRAGRVEFGLGLGLPIVRTIVRQHGGNIRFESKPGRTVFTIDLPVR